MDWSKKKGTAAVLLTAVVGILEFNFSIIETMILGMIANIAIIDPALTQPLVQIGEYVFGFQIPPGLIDGILATVTAASVYGYLDLIIWFCVAFLLTHMYFQHLHPRIMGS